jgi:predicted Zn-ribbon and HTH transcriptional regulator
MTRKFQRRVEDFLCENCGFEVQGSGYTNHCPRCLWSKHVDMHPGDRAAACGGQMVPVMVEIKGNEYILTHRCLQCGYEKRNKTASQDDFEAILKLMYRSGYNQQG